MEEGQQSFIPEEQTPIASKKERKELRRKEKARERQRGQQKRTYRRIVFWMIIFLGIGGAIFGMVKLASQSPQSDDVTASLSHSIAENDWVKGNKESSVILVEYSDFQCPACASYYPFAKQLTQEFGNDIAFVYRHFPLAQIHPNAYLAGQAAEAAGKQGQFWEMHDLLFENQQTWSSQGRDQVKGTFAVYAKQLNLDIEQFKRDTDSKEIKDKIDNDYQGGLRSKVNSTPTFFLSGEKIQNPRNYDEFRDIINQALSNNS